MCEERTQLISRMFEINLHKLDIHACIYVKPNIATYLLFVYTKLLNSYKATMYNNLQGTGETLRNSQ